MKKPYKKFEVALNHYTVFVDDIGFKAGFWAGSPAEAQTLAANVLGSSEPTRVVLTADLREPQLR